MPVAALPTGSGWDLVLATKSGPEVLSAKVLIDATGDANLCALAGYQLVRGGVLQPARFTTAWAATIPRRSTRRPCAACTAKPWPRGRFCRPTTGPGSRRSGTRSATAAAPDCTSSRSTLQFGRQDRGRTGGRAAVNRVVRLLQRVPAAKTCGSSSSATSAAFARPGGSSARPRSDAQSYVSGRLWDDAVCYSFYPIDVHRHHDNTIDIRPLEPGVVPTIPYRALIPRGADRILAAGRCIAGDAEASSAYRCRRVVRRWVRPPAPRGARGTIRPVRARCTVEPLRQLLREHRAIVPTAPSVAATPPPA